jgi:hypothetical protein
MPIIDIWLLIVLLAGLLFGLRSPAAKRRNGAIVLTLMALIYGVRAAAHHQALVLAPRLLGPTLPQPCDPAAARPPSSTAGRAHRSRCRCWPRASAASSKSRAMPDFIRPFSWRIIAQMSNAYEIYQLDLLEECESGDRVSLDCSEVSRPLQRRAEGKYHSAGLWSNTCCGHPRPGESIGPAARSVVGADGVTTVRWTDVRFVLGAGPIDQPRPWPDMFTATVRIAAEGQIVDEHLGGRR